MVDILPHTGSKKEQKNTYDKNDKYSLMLIQKIELKHLKEEILKNPEKIKNVKFQDLLNSMEISNDGEILIFSKNLNFWKERLGDFAYFTTFKDVVKDTKETENRILETGNFGIILEIWAEQAIKISGGLLFKSFRENSADANMSKNINIIISRYEFLEMQKFKLSKEEFNKEIDDIFKLMLDIEKHAEDVVGEDDLKVIKNTFFDEKDTEKKMIKIMDLMRYEGLSGNSSGTKEVLEYRLLQEKDIETKNIIKILDNPKILEWLDKNNQIEFGNIIYKYFPDDHYEITTKVFNKFKEYKKLSEEGLKRKIKDINKIRKEKGLDKLTVKDLQNLESHSEILNYLSSMLIYTKFKNKEKRYENDDSVEALYSDMVGLGQTEGLMGINDGVNIADENIDTAVEVGANVGVGVASLGVGTGAMMIGRGLVSAAIRRGMVTQLGRTGSFIGGAIGDGITFYQGTNLASNTIYKEKISDIGDLFEGWDNLEHNIESIMFMGMLNGVFKTIGYLKGTRYVKSIHEKIPKKYLDKKFIENTLKFSGLNVTTSVIMGISQTLEKLFTGKNYHMPSFKEYIELLVLLGTFHKITQIGK